MRRLLLLACLLGCGSTRLAAQEFSVIWELENQFLMPESAVFDAGTESIFVSNVNEYARDGNGFISRVAVDDASVTLRWLDGLDSPTGLAVFEGQLYFADFDSLVVADIASARVVARYVAPDSNPVLNDVAISPEGEVYVSGSGSSSIYRLDGGELRLWLHDEELLALANGLYVQGDFLLHGGRQWSVFDRSTALRVSGAITPQPALEDIDGITATLCGAYLVSLLQDDRLWRVSGQGEARPLLDGPLGGIDLYSQGDLLVVPQVGGGLTLLRQEGSCPP